MTRSKTQARERRVELEFEFDQPPQKLWRALSIPELREQWLPRAALADREATVVRPGEAISYRMRDDAPPFLESTVTFRIAANDSGGARLTIVHELDDARTVPAPANSNGQTLMLAA